jgi:hypothetical protein
MYTEARTVLRAVVVDFFFNCWCLESSSVTVLGTYQGASTIVRKTLDWKRSRISVFEVEVMP